MKIPKEVKDQMKAMRLQQLERRYFDLEMDKLSLQSAEFKTAESKAKEIDKITNSMENVKRAYAAIRDMDTN